MWGARHCVIPINPEGKQIGRPSLFFLATSSPGPQWETKTLKLILQSVTRACILESLSHLYFRILWVIRSIQGWGKNNGLFPLCLESALNMDPSHTNTNYKPVSTYFWYWIPASNFRDFHFPRSSSEEPLSSTAELPCVDWIRVGWAGKDARSVILSSKSA